MTKYPSQMQDKFNLRLPNGMKDMIIERAKENGRSINSEIIQILEDTFKNEEHKDKKYYQNSINSQTKIGITLPTEDMPEDVKVNYLEAASIYKKSPRGAAVLLRLALQKLCKHLGGDGDNINDDLKKLADKDILSKTLVKVADTIRITGNNAIHPGIIDDRDVDDIAIKLFDFLNIIVRQAITEPKEIKSLYDSK